MKRTRTIQSHITLIRRLKDEELEEAVVQVAYDCAEIAMEHRGVPCEETAEEIARAIRRWTGTTD